MRMTLCVACGELNPDLLHHHHLLPRAEGGSDDEANLITLCVTCHGLVHGQIWRPSKELGRRRAVAVRAQRAMQGGTGKLVLPPRKRRRTNIERLRIQTKVVRYAEFLDAIEAMRANGATSLRKLAHELNSNGVRTGKGNKWSAPTLCAKLKGAARYLAKHQITQRL